VRRGLLLIIAPVITGEFIAEGSSVHPDRAVQISGASSDTDRSIGRSMNRPGFTALLVSNFSRREELAGHGPLLLMAGNCRSLRSSSSSGRAGSAGRRCRSSDCRRLLLRTHLAPFGG